MLRAAKHDRSGSGWMLRCSQHDMAGYTFGGRLWMRYHLLLAGASLEARLGTQVGADVVFGDEEQPRVRIRWLHETARKLVEEKLDHRIEALEIRLLVDGKVEIPGIDLLQRLGQQVIATGMHPFGGQVVLLHDLADALCASGIDCEHPFQVLMAQIVRLDAREFLVHRGAGGNLHKVDGRARSLDRLLRAIDTRLNVQRPRRRNEAHDIPATDKLDDALPHLNPGLEEVLPDIGHAGILTAIRSIGDLGKNGNASLPRRLHGSADGCGVDDRDGDTISFAAD